MKTSIFLLLMLGCCQLTQAQQTDTTWFDKKWEKTDKANSYYYRVVETTAPEAPLHVKDYFTTGELQMEGYYKSLKPEVKEGTFIWWHKNGVKFREALFTNNDMLRLTEWDAQGKQTSHKEVVNVVTYVNGKPIYEPKYIEAAPKFPVENGLIDYLKSNIHYPEEAATAKVGGRVMVRFVVTKNGKIKHAEIVEGIHPLLDAEALRVVKAMPDWIPGRQGGKAIDTNMHLPINFNPM